MAIAFTVIEAGVDRAHPAKTFAVAPDGRPVVSHHGGQPAAGLAHRCTLTGSAAAILRILGDTLDRMPSSQALVCAPPPPGNVAWPFVTRTEASGRTDVIARSRENFAAPAGPALLGLDFDSKAWPAELQVRVRDERDQISGILASVAPVFASAATLRRASSSAGIRNRETGATTDANAGQHRFLLAKDGLDVERAVRALHERLVLGGWGWGFVHETGHVEVRSLIDVIASSAPERLWFEGKVKLADPRLEHLDAARRPTLMNAEGRALDTALILELSADERSQLDETAAAIIAENWGEASRRQTAWKARRRDALIAKGIDPEKAARTVGLAVERHVLSDDFEVSFDDGTSSTVAEILADPMAFHRKTGPDPLEPEYGGGRNKAILYGDGNPVRIESQAHGRITYMLQDYRRYFEEPADKSNAPAAIDWFEQVPAVAVADEIGPLDIFGDDDPAELGRLPSDCLPALLQRWVATEARRKGVPEAFAAAAVVTATSSAIGANIRIQVQQNDDGWTEGANLWTALVADPGSAKSPIISSAVAPLRHLDSEWAKQDMARHAEWVVASKRKGASAPLPGPEPKIRRAVVDDITGEKQIRVFADNPKGILRAPDELVGMLSSFGAYKAGGDGDRSQVLRFFDGGSVTYDRVGSGTIFAERASLAVLAGTQPDKLREIVKNLGSDGLLQRFLIVLHDGVDREAIDETPDRAALAGYDRMISVFLSSEYGLPPAIRMHPDAHALFAAAWKRLKLLKQMPGVGPAFKGHVEKWGKILPRIILVFHSVEQFERHGAIDPAAEVSPASVERAVRFARFLMRHALRFYSEFFGATEATSEARWIAGFLLTRPELEQIGRRDVYDARKSLRGPAGSRVLQASMAELEIAGWCAVTKRDSVGPSMWSVDPRIHVRFVERGQREKAERSLRQAKILQASGARKWIDSDEGAYAGNSPSQPSVFD